MNLILYIPGRKRGKVLKAGRGPKISVIIPVYNSGQYLYRCLDSITGQTYSDLQILLIDDGSTDESGRVCDQYAERDERIRVIHQKNGGVSKARNAGLDAADGEYYSFPDSDDYLEPDTYTYLADRLKEHDYDLINFEYFTTYPEGKETGHRAADSAYGLLSREEAHRTVLLYEPFACNKLYRAEIIKGLRFREDIFRGEDGLFAHAAIENARTFWFDTRALYHYVQSEESACRGRFRESQLTGMKLFEEYRNMYREKYPMLWKEYLKGALNLPIILYNDMYMDERNWEKEQKDLIREFRIRYREVISTVRLPARVRLKYFIFRYCPDMFCLIHNKHVQHKRITERI